MFSKEKIFCLLLFLLIACSYSEKIAPTQIQIYGLGNHLTASVSNDKDYEWYRDQGNTGTYSSINCGPAATTMAIKWNNPNSTLTPEDARKKYKPNGGWWYSSDIINYLNDNSVNNYTIALSDINQLKNKINNGDIIILCLDMSYVEYQTKDSYHVNKFYSASTRGWGHFIVIKGYKEVDNQTYYEAYDPYSLGVSYLDNSLKGKDRYYKASNLDVATNNWWDYAIVTPRSGVIDGRILADPNLADPNRITHKSGQ